MRTGCELDVMRRSGVDVGGALGTARPVMCGRAGVSPRAVEMATRIK
jgi:hypothetical protein